MKYKSTLQENLNNLLKYNSNAFIDYILLIAFNYCLDREQNYAAANRSSSISPKKVKQWN